MISVVKANDKNNHDAADIICEECKSIIATLHEAALMPPPAVLEALARHKAEILALLRPGRDGWSAENWHVFFDERAGIAKFDGGLPRSDAEAQAFACCIVEWLNRNSAHSPPGRCLGCGDHEHGHDPLLPYG